MHETILVLDGDEARGAVHAFGLSCAGFRATQAADAHTAHSEILQRRPDLILLFGDRLDTATLSMGQAIMSRPSSRRTSVVIVLAHGTTAEAAAVRELGFRDCLLGSVTPQKLLDFVQECLGRVRSTRILRCGLELDVDTGTLTRNGSSVILGPTERRLLAALFEHPERVQSRTQLQRRIGSARAANPGRVIDISVCRLRQALRRLDCGEILQTIRSRGYRLALREARTPGSGASFEQSSDDPERFFFLRPCNAPVFFLDYIGATP